MDRTSNARPLASIFAVVLAACSAAHTLSDAGTIRCTSSGECYGAVPYCDPALGVCVPCRDDEDCGLLVPGVPRYQCDSASGECEECVTDAWCGGGLGGPGVCDPTSHRCFQGCEGDGDCERFFAERLCHETLRICVSCVTGPRCDPAIHFPVPCLAAEHCPPDAPICSSRLCTVSCDADGRCPEGRHCERNSMVCVACTMNAHCPDSVCTSDFACLET